MTKIIDFHTHCFPDKIAQNAVKRLSVRAGGLEYYTDGGLTSLKQRMAEDGVGKSVVLSIATNAEQQKNVNDFAAKINAEDNIIAFGSVYPHSDDALYELERIKSLGLLGVKLHPDYQEFNVDDEKFIPLYKKISSLGLITVFHAGLDYGCHAPYGATPEKMACALKYFDSPVVAAHFGGLNLCEDVMKHLCGREIYFDTAFSYAAIPKYYVEKIIEKHGADKILFGTDLPWHTAKMELKLLDSIGLDENSMEKILSRNAEMLLGI